MLIDRTDSTSSRPRAEPALPMPASVGWWPGGALAFTAMLGVVLVYALRDSGSYGLVVRQEDGLVIWWVLGLGVALGLFPRRQPPRAVLAVIGALVLYGAWTAASLAWTDSPERTTAEIGRVLDYAGLVALVACLVDGNSWSAAAGGLAAGAVVVCGLALTSRLAPGAIPAGGVAQVFGTSRLSYPFGYWNAVGAWAAMTAAVGVAWSANDQRPLPRALALATLPLSTTVAYLSFSRAALAGLALAAIAVLALSRHRWTALLHLGIAAALAMMCIESVRAEPQILHGTGAAGAYRVALMLVGTSAMGALGALATREARIDGWRVSRKVAVRISGAVAAAVVAVAAALGPSVGSRAWHQFHNPHVLLTGDPAQRLTSLSGNRYELWKAAMHAFGAHPLTGLGAGTFEFWWNRHATLEEFVRNAHSLWLESMAELGLPGLLSIVAVAATALALAFKVRRRALSSGSVAAATGATAALIVFLWQASVDWMWQSTAVTVFGLAAVAVLAGALIARAPRVSRRWRAGLVLAAAIAGAAQLPGLLSTAEVDRSQRALREGNAASALMWANASVSTEPWAASPHLQRGLVLEAAGRLRLAALELRRAIAREPDNFRHWVVLARIEKEARDTAQAGRDYARGQAMRPYTPLSGG